MSEINNKIKIDDIIINKDIKLTTCDISKPPCIKLRNQPIATQKTFYIFLIFSIIIFLILSTTCDKYLSNVELSIVLSFSVFLSYLLNVFSCWILSLIRNFIV